MLDIVEIALDQTTDFTDFEKLACEVIRNEGYPDIKPLGGLSDKGQDAVVERLYEREGPKSRIVFQITTQETVEAKLRQTIARLDAAHIVYTQLTIVTSCVLSSERQRTLERIAREQDVALDIMERKTLANRLADYENGIFSRHFPDIQKQVQVLLAKSSEGKLDTESMVRNAIAFTTSGASEHARTRVLGELVQGLLLRFQGSGATVKDLADVHHELLPQAVPLTEEQIDAALERRASAGMVERDPDGKYRPTEAAVARYLASSIDWSIKGRTLASDVADVVEQAAEGSVDMTQRRYLERNARRSLALLFRLMGLEISSQLLGRTEMRGQQVGSHEEMITEAKRDLPDTLGKMLVAALAELVANPNEEQAETLKAYACGYVGASLIEVDPAVREFQITRLREKVFVLDTDFLIDCLVVDCPVFAPSLNLVQSMVDAGIRVIVPDECVVEAAAHAGLAHQTVNHFGPRIHGLTPAEATERIYNAFAKGWYFHSLRDPIAFERYILNYLEPSAPARFMRRVVAASLPNEVEIGDVAALLGVSTDEQKVDVLSEALLAMIRMSKKSQYRSEEQMASLARTDARLYCTAFAYEEKTTGRRQGRALGGCCYLVTASLRFIKAVERVFNQPDEISARPNTLAALLQLVGKSQISAKNFVALFDNPLLQYAVSVCREDVELLLDAGLSTRGKNLARLVWDLDNGLHAKIATVKQMERVADERLGEREETEVDRSYLELIKDAGNRGYAPLPAAAPVLREMGRLSAEREDLSMHADELTGRLKEMESAIEVFGRKRQRYLRKIARGEPHHKAH